MENTKYEIKIVEKEAFGISGFFVVEDGIKIAWFRNYSAAFDFVARTTQATRDLTMLTPSFVRKEFNN